MKILRQKAFSMKEENIKKILIFTPKDLNKLPKIIQNYFKSGISNDLYKLAQLENTLQYDYVVGPVPCIGKFSSEKNGQIFKSVFSQDLDLFYLDKADIWMDESGNLYKKSGIIFSSFKQINNKELKDYLKKQIIEDDLIGEAYKEDANYSKIVALEKQILAKIDRL